MAIAAFLFVRLDASRASGGDSDSRSASLRASGGADWDADAHDRSLAIQIQGNDADEAGRAFEALYNAYAVPLWRLARQFTGSDAQAEDVVEDVFVSLWIRRHEWRVSSSVRAYLYSAVRNRALNAIRDMGHLETVPEALVVETEAPPDADVEMHDLETALREAVNALPERQRTAVLLFWHESMNMSEIARIIGITPQGARKLLLTAQGSLRETVAKYL